MFRYTIRELALVISFLAVACAALKYASEVWWLVLSASALLGIMAAAVMAVADRGRRQAMAAGFVVCVVIYMAVSRSESQDWSLPTTKVLQWVYESMAIITWRSAIHGEIVLDYEPSELNPNLFMVPESSINRTQLIQIGHLLFAIAFGYLGSRFAGWIYQRRARESSCLPQQAGGEEAR
jgi:hypothetical protein